jgi:hypothetical protein
MALRRGRLTRIRRPGELNSGDQEIVIFSVRVTESTRLEEALERLFGAPVAVIAKNAAPGASDGAQAIWRARWHSRTGAPERQRVT